MSPNSGDVASVFKLEVFCSYSIRYVRSVENDLEVDLLFSPVICRCGANCDGIRLLVGDRVRPGVRKVVRAEELVCRLPIVAEGAKIYVCPGHT